MNKTVETYKVESKEKVIIPRCELAPGMVKADVEGVCDDLWVEAKADNKPTFKHPPFQGVLRKRIIKIKTSLSKIYPQTYRFWEDGFRADTHPEREIGIWLHIARIYAKHSKGKNERLKKELFDLILTCSTSDPESTPFVFERKLLRDAEVSSVIDDFFSDFFHWAIGTVVQSESGERFVKLDDRYDGFKLITGLDSQSLNAGDDGLRFFIPVPQNLSFKLGENVEVNNADRRLNFHLRE